MKSHIAVVALVATTGVYGRRTSTTTITADTCPSELPETMITVTKGMTVTYCPTCPAMMPGFTTVYTTVFKSLCPTGLVPKTHTITETCPEATPTWTPGPKHIPQGYTVATKECKVCGPKTSSVTLTESCGCEAHEGVPGPPASPATTSPAKAPMPAPAKPTETPAAAPPAEACTEMKDGQPNCPSTAPQAAPSAPPSMECTQDEDGQPQCSTAGGHAASSPTPATGGKPGQAAPPYPTSTQEGHGVPNRLPAGTANLPSNVVPGSPTSGAPVPAVPGAAVRVGSLAAFSATAVAVVVAALAFAL